MIEDKNNGDNYFNNRLLSRAMPYKIFIRIKSDNLEIFYATKTHAVHDINNAVDNSNNKINRHDEPI